MDKSNPKQTQPTISLVQLTFADWEILANFIDKTPDWAFSIWESLYRNILEVDLQEWKAIAQELGRTELWAARKFKEYVGKMAENSAIAWADHHSKSEQFASLATVLAKEGQVIEAAVQYRLAAEAELAALETLEALGQSKSRTLGITVVSAVTLWFKVQEFGQAKRLAYRWLATESLPAFAVSELEALLREILILEKDAIAD